MFLQDNYTPKLNLAHYSRLLYDISFQITILHRLYIAASLYLCKSFKIAAASTLIHPEHILHSIEFKRRLLAVVSLSFKTI